MSLPALFVTGTDTGVGKTVVSACLAAALRSLGMRVGVMKPAESGCQRHNGVLLAQDAQLLREMSDCSAPLSDVNPYALEASLAPALAAEIEQVDIDLDHIQACFERIAAAHDVTIVEGAGGLLTPLWKQQTMRDLARDLRLPIIVVTRNILGAINHAALTAEAARNGGLTVLGTVLNNPVDDLDSAAKTNPAAMARWGGAPLLATMPFFSHLTADALTPSGFQILTHLGFGELA